MIQERARKIVLVFLGLVFSAAAMGAMLVVLAPQSS